MEIKSKETDGVLTFKQETLCFQPFNEDARIKFRALKVLNDFKTMGFVNRGEWLNEVFEACPDLDSGNGAKILQHFWSLRYFDESLIQRLEILVENLKEEL